MRRAPPAARSTTGSASARPPTSTCPALPDDATAKFWENKGCEIALHVNTNCADWTPTTLPGFYSSQKADFFAKFPSIAPLRTNRTHCIAWSDWATQPKVELANGIRLDTNYYFWPPAWVDDRPGFMTGSGMPMRFADLDGTMIDVYQAATQMTDESGQTYPVHDRHPARQRDRLGRLLRRLHGEHPRRRHDREPGGGDRELRRRRAASPS